MPRILIDGKILLPNHEIKKCIESFYRSSHGDGAKKLCYAIRESFYGIGEKTIQKYLNEMDCHRSINPRFDNLAPLQPISAETIMERHQIDIVDLTAIAVTIDDKEYKYVLSIIDVFSRFLWLRALTNKNSNTVAMELYKIYIEYGPPKIIQSDQGSEFKGNVKELCNLLKTKMIYSRSHHPQSQGKDERSHQTWKKKIHQDLMNTQNEGICDWVTGLPALQRTYNEGVHRSLGITPYECFFGIRSNHLISRLPETHSINDETFEIEECPAVYNTEDSRREADVQHHLNVLHELRTKAKNKSDKSSEKMVRNKLSKKPPSRYVLGNKVFIKHVGKDSRVSRGGSSIIAPKVFGGIILESDFINHQYRVEFHNEGGKKQNKWISVSDITSTSHKEEQRKKQLARTAQKQKQ